MQELETVPYLLYEPEYETGILWVKFNNPEKLNACVGTAERRSTLAKIGEYMRAGDDDPKIRVIVLTGVGRGFCSGADSKGTADWERGDNFLGNAPGVGVDSTRQGFLYGATKLVKDVNYIRKPTVAMINGVAAGLGMDLALACDIRYGCEHTRLIGYQQVGQILENGAAYWLPRIVGVGRALEFAFTGFMEAEQAVAWGVLNKLVPSEELEAEVRALCDRMAKSPPITQWINKRNIRHALNTDLETTAVLTSNAASILNQSEDAKEARRALGERRAPHFEGV